MKLIGRLYLERKLVKNSLSILGLALYLFAAISIVIGEGLKMIPLIYLTTIIYLLWASIVETPIHENLHKYAAKIFNFDFQINLKYKWRNRLWRIDTGKDSGAFPYCRVIGNQSYYQLIIIAAFPLTISILWLSLYVLSKNYLLLIPFAISSSSWLGDLLYILWASYCVIRNWGKRIVFIDDGLSLEVREK